MNPTDPFSGIAAFVRAAEAQNFTLAARRLGLTPSAVSKSVSRLEAELGIRLFNRSPRKVTLTPEGEIFFQRCQELVHGVEDARSLLAGTRSHPRGSMKVFAPVSLSQAVIAPALPGWLKSYPALQLDLIVTDRHPDLAEERFDAGIWFGTLRDSSLIARPLPKHAFITVAAPAYLAHHPEPMCPSELVNHNCLGFLVADSGSPRTWTFRRDDKTYSYEPRGNLRSDQGRILVHAVEAGAGIAQLPCYLVADSLRSGRVIPVLADYDVDGPPLWVVYPKSRQRSPKIMAFVAFALELGVRIEKAADDW